MSDMVIIFLNGNNSRITGLTFTFSFFFGGFGRGLGVPKQISSGSSLSFVQDFRYVYK